MLRMEAGAVALACAALLAGAGGAHATAGIPKDKDELTQEITLRCIYDMGEFGEIGVQECTRADRAAAEALTRYPPQVQSVVDRCLQTQWGRGYATVQMCVEQDLAADAALAALPPEHAQAIEACRQELGAQGAARVKGCVDSALAAIPAQPK